MSDIGLFWDSVQGAADFAVDANDLATEDGFETAVMLSLFTDRQAEANDVLPDGQTDRRGWWGDAFPAVEGDKIGSRLWLLSREKDTATALRRAKDYATEALAWMVEDRAATSVEVTTASVPAREAGRNWLVMTIVIQRPKADPVTYRFNFNWVSQQAQRA
jgi:phage gp46-like protein